MKMRWSTKIMACSLTMAVFVLDGCVVADGMQPFDADRVTLLQFEPLMEGEDIAVISTGSGEIRFRFFPSEAPDAVRNFIALAREGYYDNRTISGSASQLKACEDVMISGASTQDGLKGVCRVNNGRPFKQEISANLWPFPGAVSVLGDRSERGDSRFFITGSREVSEKVLGDLVETQYPPPVVEAFRLHGGVPEYALEYSIFGQVVQGQDVVDDIVSRLGGGESLSIHSVSMSVWHTDT